MHINSTGRNYDLLSCARMLAINTKLINIFCLIYRNVLCRQIIIKIMQIKEILRVKLFFKFFYCWKYFHIKLICVVA